jgi:hypothetical protein
MATEPTVPVILLDWSAHISETLADLQIAASEGDDALVVDISVEALRVGATDADVADAIDSGRQIGAQR